MWWTYPTRTLPPDPGHRDYDDDIVDWASDGEEQRYLRDQSKGEHFGKTYKVLIVPAPRRRPTKGILV